ncbi:MAG: hypothetical protein ACLPTQ_09400 [Terriglobales bacterium]
MIRSEIAFRLWHLLHPKPSLKAGEYRFERATSLPQVYERIARGDITSTWSPFPKAIRCSTSPRLWKTRDSGRRLIFCRLSKPRPS